MVWLTVNIESTRAPAALRQSTSTSEPDPLLNSSFTLQLTPSEKCAVAIGEPESNAGILLNRTEYRPVALRAPSWS